MSRLIWIDLEMTGLNVVTDTILEIATIVTDADLNILAEGPNLVIAQPQAVLDKMDDWNQQHHGSSGLIAHVQASTCTMQEAATRTMAFLSEWLAPGQSPMCGNSVCQDRRFLAKHMPEVEGFFHYRALDVTSLKLAMQYWQPDYTPHDKGIERHRALDDIRASIAECQAYQSWISRSQSVDQHGTA